MVHRVEHIETHISHLFLTGNYAYKLKKPVRFDFLDFSTLENRKQQCENELRLNARFAPAIYEAVVPISLQGRKLVLGGTDNVIEYVVKMKQFDNKLLFDTLEKEGKLSDRLLEEVTEKIAIFHKSAEPQAEYWSVEEVSVSVEQNIRTCEGYTPAPIDSKKLALLGERSRQALSKLGSLIRKRQRTHVRAVHGDLHLGNMCVYEGRAELFDGIEFNPQLSNCDVWADLAFFVMDLFARGRLSEAALVWNRYLQDTDDFEGIELLSFYIAYRAMVRAKVSCLELDSAHGREELRLKSDAARYLEFALQALEPSVGKIVAVGGLSGSGKSTLSSMLSRRLGAVHIRSDAVRKHLGGVPLYQPGPPELYSEEMNQRTYRGMLDRALPVLRSGRAVVVDAVFHSPVWRTGIEQFAQEKGCSFYGIWCTVSPKIAKERIRTRLGDISDADEGILSRQQSYNLESIGWRSIDTTQGGPTQVLELALGYLEEGI